MRISVIAFFLMAGIFPAKGQVLISLLLGDKLNSGKVEFGLDGGVNYPNMRGLQGGKAKGLFNIGFYFDIKTKNPKILMALNGRNDKTEKSFRNISTLNIVFLQNLNPMDVLNHKYLLIENPTTAIKFLESRV